MAQYADGDKVAFLGDDTASTQRSAEFYGALFDNMTVTLTNSYADYKQAFLDLQSEADILIVYNNVAVEDWDEEDAKLFFVENTSIPTGALLEWMAPYVLQVTARVLTEHGEWPAEIAPQILDGASPADIPVANNRQADLIINLDVAQSLDIVFSPTILRNATIVGGEEDSAE